MSWRDYLKPKEVWELADYEAQRDDARRDVAVLSHNIRVMRNTCMQRARRAKQKD